MGSLSSYFSQIFLKILKEKCPGEDENILYLQLLKSSKANHKFFYKQLKSLK